MRSISLDEGLVQKVRTVLSHSPYFDGLSQDQISKLVLSHGTVLQLDEGDELTREGDPSDSFFLLLRGSVVARVNVGSEVIEAGQARPPQILGEMGLLLEQARTATVVAQETVMALRVDVEGFHELFAGAPSFALSLSRALAKRLYETSRQIPLPPHATDEEMPAAEVLELLPFAFIKRHRVLPLAVEGKAVILGFVDDPSSPVIRAARQHMPGLELRPRRIANALLDRVLQAHAGVSEWKTAAAEAVSRTVAPETPPAPVSSRLDAMLARVLEEGASDLHLSAGQKPHWRIDGEIRELADLPALGNTEVLELFGPALPPRHRQQFDELGDAEFAYSMLDGSRFRITLFQDHHGVCAALRPVPARIPTFEQLGLPDSLRQLCDQRQGLVLLTGPSGSGRSTTLAAMIDRINHTRRAHIITLEQPIEFVHPSRRSLVHQRELITHVKSHAQALQAALHEDPDVLVVGQLPDAATILAAIAAANTGHLVLAVLPAVGAAGALDLLLSVFPPDQQPRVRALLADVLQGIVSQILCRKLGGGRVAAFETMLINGSLATVIREGRIADLDRVMVQTREQGNLLLNESLEKLVEDRQLARDEALSRTLDKGDLDRRLLMVLARQP